jgi:hypothetical protein
MAYALLSVFFLCELPKIGLKHQPQTEESELGNAHGEK